MDTKVFEHRFEHAKFSLSNVQDNIRFIDRKVAGCMGLVVIALGFFISRSTIAGQLFIKTPDLQWIVRLEWIFLALVVLSLIAAIVFAATTLFPMQTKDPRLVNRKWVLFPIATKNEEVVILRDEIAKKLSNTLTEEQILEEYADQLATTGQIQTLKMASCKKMILATWVFCVLIFLLGVTSLACCVISQSCVAIEDAEVQGNVANGMPKQ